MNNGVLTGADQLHSLAGAKLRGQRYALLTNPTGIDSRFRSTIDLCAAMEDSKLSAFFACEHGLRNEKQAGVKFEDHIDDEYGIPVYSLYGANRKPTADSLNGLDAIVFDIQDLGVRFYTYLTTLVYAMQACAEHDVQLIVLDRPNPLGGMRVEGGFLKEAFFSMVGAWRMPTLSGLTIGEFARLVNGQMEKPCRLEVIPLQGWRRGMEYPDTGLPWIMPSPNMPTMDTVRVYGGNCLFEGTNLSEGRGTTKPFELIGSPWLNHRLLCDTMNHLGLPGVHYHPVTFTPTFQKHAGQLCRGIMTSVTDKSVFRPVESGLTLLHHVVALHPDDFAWRGSEDGQSFIDILSGSDEVRKRIASPGALDEILAEWRSDASEWEMQRQPYLLYEN